MFKKEDKIYRDVLSFCKELRPVEDLCYLEHKYNGQLLPLAEKHDLLGMPVDKRYGGRGASNMQYIHYMERIAEEGTGVRTFFSGHSSLGQKTVQRFGSEELKKRYLVPSTKGKCTFAFALTEPEAGSNPLGMQMAYQERKGWYVLNGVKYLISNSGIADAMIVFAKGKDKRVSAFVIDAHAEGIAREDILAKMGMPTSNTGMFELTDFKVPKENVLGKLGEGWEIAKYALMNGRLSVAAGCVGVIHDSLLEAERFAKERVQHGKVIAKHQLVQEHFARMKLAFNSSQLMVHRAALLLDQYEGHSSEENFLKADAAVAEAKLFSAEQAWDAVDRAVQVHGGRGWSFLYRPGRHLVDTRVCRIYEGTDEILKLKIAEAFLGKGFGAYS